jgi:hypothetical protein
MASLLTARGFAHGNTEKAASNQRSSSSESMSARTKHLRGINIKLISDDTADRADEKTKNVVVAVEESVGADQENSCIYALVNNQMTRNKDPTFGPDLVPHSESHWNLIEWQIEDTPLNSQAYAP